ncbi:TetR/AcrR family transcriptional regulator [Micromonospora sp. SL1-18]|uniref:TetR/AcrR family transcriptional regulator n=1 Tax=Micromonospora sp. SL1-18 TaxID=3399128 RepID=UPI003A4DCD20
MSWPTGGKTDRQGIGRGAANRSRRADAERNIEAILDATLESVTADGTFNMTAIARAAGVSRVTLYSHFPTREELVEATLDRGVARAAELLKSLPLDEVPASQALALLVRCSWQILHRQRNIFTLASTALPPAVLRAYHEPVLGRLEKLVVRGQADGDIRADLPLEWLVGAIYSLMHLAAEQLSAGLLPYKRAGDIVTTTVLSLLAADHAALARALAHPGPTVDPDQC